MKKNKIYRHCEAKLKQSKMGLLCRSLRSLLAMTILFFIYGLWTIDYGLAEDKQWSGGYDASSWDKDANWFPTGVPTLSDDTIVTKKDVNVVISDTTKTFNAKSLTVAGRNDSTVTVSDFIYGLITPSNNTDNALYIRKGGNVILQGSGAITLKGSFKNSEESLPDEPAFMFGAE